jgi:hypothetical protein
MTRGRQKAPPPRARTLRDIAARFGGRVLGDPGTRVRHVASLENAPADAIAFVASERYLQQLKSTRAAAVIVNEAVSGATTLPRIVCENPYAYFAHVSALLNPPPVRKTWRPSHGGRGPIRDTRGRRVRRSARRDWRARDARSRAAWSARDVS